MVDMQTAKNAGIKNCYCGVLWGFRDDYKLKNIMENLIFSITSS